MLTAALFLTACAATFAEELPLAPSTPRERTVGILVYEGVELLDFAGPGEAFSAAHGPDGHAFRVVTVAKEKRPVVSQGFVTITPTYSIADCPPLALLVLPGGHVPDDDAALVAWVRECAGSAECVMSVCNGAFLLARAGLVDGLEITSHRSALEPLALQFPRTKVLTNRRFVDSGRVMTCAGVSAGIDGALHLIARLVDPATARATAHYMEYDWRPEELAALHATPGKPVGENPLHGVARAVRESGLTAGISAHAALEPKPGERELCDVAWRLAGVGKAEDARALLELALELHRDSPRAVEALSGLSELQGRRDDALLLAREVLRRLDAGRHAAPEDYVALVRNAAASRVERLAGDASKLRFVCEPCAGDCDELRYLAAGVCPQCRMALVEAPAAR